VLLRPTRIVRRIGRAAIVAIGSLAIAAWVVVPLLLDRAYTIQDEFSRGKVYYDSFGATQIMKWMVSGEIFDRNRIPVLSVLAGVGLLVCLWRWRRDERARALVAVGLLSLALFFGRSTWGSALKLLPGSGDLFLRRYVFGVHLAGLYLIGYAMASIGRAVVAFVRRHRPLARPEISFAVLALVAIAVLSPAWLERGSWAALGARWIHEQQVFDANDGADVASLVRTAESRGPGRFYGGMRSNWGATYRVGQVPLYAVLTNLDTMELGFTRPTWSLASPAEYRFHDVDAAAFDVFDVRYVIEPNDRPPPTDGAQEIASKGRHVLYEMPDDGAVDVFDIAPAITADRTDLGVKIAPWLTSDLPAAHVVPGISFAAFPAARATLAAGEIPGTEPGTVLSLVDDIANGVVAARVDLRRPAAVVLKESFDNRWTVTVDGSEVSPQMFAPGFVGRAVGAGEHEVVFAYAPFPRYDVLLLAGAFAFAALFVWERRRSGRTEAVAASGGRPVP
jgi:hypothetical protein